LKITVIGSTSRIGRHLVADARRRGHEIIAFTRRPHELPDGGILARVVTGDGRDPTAIAHAVDGADAVIAIVGAPSRKGPHATADVARVVTHAMADAGVRRFVAPNPYPIVGNKPRLPLAVLRAIFSAAYADAAEMERVVAATDLDWTIARLNRLLDKPPRGTATITRELLDDPRAITRADAAATLLDLAESDTFARTAVNVSGT
jgi:uncharacterized protein YbjT (DUF2867 family)